VCERERERGGETFHIPSKKKKKKKKKKRPGLSRTPSTPSAQERLLDELVALASEAQTAHAGGDADKAGEAVR